MDRTVESISFCAIESTSSVLHRKTNSVCTTQAQREGAPAGADGRMCLRAWMAPMVEAASHLDDQGIAGMTSK